MEKTKRKNAEFNPVHFWRIFLPLVIILLLCLRFPIRITLPDLYDDILLYGSISLASFLTGVWIYRRTKWVYRRLLALIFLCGVLAGWQVVDLGVLRLQDDNGYCFCWMVSGNSESYIGGAWYVPRFKNPDILCHGIYERFIGNSYIAITTETQHTPWYACGG